MLYSKLKTITFFRGMSDAVAARTRSRQFTSLYPGPEDIPGLIANVNSKQNKVQ